MSSKIIYMHRLVSAMKLFKKRMTNFLFIISAMKFFKLKSFKVSLLYLS